ncbi:MAG: hypothetical protein CMK09_17040 [Ponticaulis sp.]|nr:hypothetical protein [Ponticaulis sp.]|tara:strand:- start:2241 stop:2825 length:585 start_codon:yes stop_codon:yes gene_type:complete
MSADKKSFPYILVVSLCANMLMMGAVGGMWLKTQDSQERPDRDRPRIERRMGGPIEERVARTAMEDLPREERREFRRKLGMEWRSARELRREMEEIRTRISAAMAADTYSAETVEQIFGELRAKEDEVRARFHDSLSEYLSELSNEDRLKLLERAEQRQERRFERRDGDRDRRGPPPPRPDGFGPREHGPPPRD